MTKSLTRVEAAAYLQSHDNYVILTHIRPDGDTLGCASALCLGLRSLGKTAQVLDIADSADALGVLMLVLAIDAEKCSRGNG